MKKIEEIKKIFWEMNEVSFTKEETTEETAGAAEETPSAADREVSPQEESEVTAE